jgi:hypothetical protein
MERTTDERLEAWMAETRRDGFRRRNWPVVRSLAAVAIGLLLASLVAELLLGSSELAVAACAGAALSGAAMLAYFLDQRLFVERPPA